MRRLQEGDTIYHKFKDMVGGKEAGFDWTATVQSLNPDDNTIEMELLSGTGGQWTEQWDYQITMNALWDGEYRRVESGESNGSV